MHVLKGVKAGNDVSKFVGQRILADLAEQVTFCMLDTVLNTFVFVMKNMPPGKNDQLRSLCGCCGRGRGEVAREY
jgi:hypothetical protein